jgi:hypothetical protein
MPLTSITGALLLSLAMLLLSAVCLVVFRRWLRSRVAADDAPDIAGPWPFFQKRPLTPVEQVLYFRLVATLPECMVLAQVPLSRFLGVSPGHNFQAWMNRINRMSVDYLVCLKDATIVAAIELDDQTHARSDRKVADEKKSKALADAGIVLIRWQAGSLPDEAAIRAAFTK